MSERDYRFSDVVRALDTTPKSFRRWLLTLGVQSEGGGWLSFSPVQIIEYAVMRNLVDWGISIKDSARLAREAVGIILAAADEGDGPADLDPPTQGSSDFYRLLYGSDLRKIYVARRGGEIFIDDERPASDLPPKSSTKRYGLGAFLTLDLGQIVFDASIALGGDAQFLEFIGLPRAIGEDAPTA